VLGTEAISFLRFREKEPLSLRTALLHSLISELPLQFQCRFHLINP